MHRSSIIQKRKQSKAVLNKYDFFTGESIITDVLLWIILDILVKSVSLMIKHLN